MKLFAVYLSLVLRYPRLVLAVVMLCVGGAALSVGEFRLDASADSLVVEGDPDLAYSREINARFGSSDFVFVAYTPREPLFSEVVLNDLRTLRDALLDLERVSSVDSILSVPLFKVAGASLSDVADNILTLDDASPDLVEVEADLLSNEAYRNVLLSTDGETTALVVNFTPNEELESLLAERDALRLRDRQDELDAVEQEHLKTLSRRHTALQKQAAAELHEDIGSIRAILKRHGGMAEIHMGGVPMIADDLVSYVKRDLVSFGSVMLLFVIAALWLFFRNWRFVLIPLVCSASILVLVTGLLGLLDWPVTVISSNFMSLLLIITISLTVHLIVRYRELQLERPDESHAERLHLVLRSMIVPCTYTSLTTMVAFASLAVSDIPPVVDFGWMMVLGVFTAFVATFLLFPALMSLFRELKVAPAGRAMDITPLIGRFTERHGRSILAVALLLSLVTVVGIGKLQVENSFISYFDEDTDIYQGMVAIDTRMGGTTPLDVIVTMSPAQDTEVAGSSIGSAAGAADEWEDEWEDEWDEEWGDESASEAEWFTSDKMRTISRMHDFLDELPQTGKVLSLATLLDLAYQLNGERELNSLELGILYSRIPLEYRETLLKPYVSVTDDQLRFSIRVLESDPSLRRGELMDTIREGMVEEFGLEPEQVRLSGMLVLYNNMLESLYASQIETIGMVMGVIFLM
ncbi:MAG TPA: MMPL family transporter, partial [Pseudomonadaceae bacterium]|nr:MMPL family transporter [Pseudomonadaceae bacterium]